MEQRRCVFILLAAGTVAFIGVLIVLVFGVPLFCGTMCAEDMILPWVRTGTEILLLMAGIGVLAALTVYMRISIRIGRGVTFEYINVKDLRMIACLLALAAAVLMIAGFILFMMGVLIHFCVILLLISAGCFAMGALAFAISELLRRAVKLQEETDLTI